MKKIDNEGLLFCSIQGEMFEKSLSYEKCSSSIFIRRYMNSKFANRVDNEGFLYEASDFMQGYDEINDEYGKSEYGKEKYLKEELFWIGYIYRYLCYTFEISSSNAYKIIKGPELRKAYRAYHTLDPLNAIERLLESKNISFSNDDQDIIHKGVKLLIEIKNRKKTNG